MALAPRLGLSSRRGGTDGFQQDLLPQRLPAILSSRSLGIQSPVGTSIGNSHTSQHVENDDTHAIREQMLHCIALQPSIYGTGWRGEGIRVARYDRGDCLRNVLVFTTISLRRLSRCGRPNLAVHAICQYRFKGHIHPNHVFGGFGYEATQVVENSGRSRTA